MNRQCSSFLRIIELDHVSFVVRQETRDRIHDIAGRPTYMYANAFLLIFQEQKKQIICHFMIHYGGMFRKCGSQKKKLGIGAPMPTKKHKRKRTNTTHINNTNY